MTTYKSNTTERALLYPGLQPNDDCIPVWVEYLGQTDGLAHIRELSTSPLHTSVESHVPVTRLVRMSETAKRLVRARERAGLTIGQMAAMSNLSARTIRLHEKGELPVWDPDCYSVALYLYASYYDVSRAWLLGESTEIKLPDETSNWPECDRVELQDLLNSLPE